MIFQKLKIIKIFILFILFHIISYHFTFFTMNTNEANSNTLSSLSNVNHSVDYIYLDSFERAQFANNNNESKFKMIKAAKK